MYGDIMEKIKNNNKKDAIIAGLSSFLPYIIIIIVVVLIRTFLVTPIKVNGSSMMMTLEHGDTMILNKIGMKIQSFG